MKLPKGDTLFVFVAALLYEEAKKKMYDGTEYVSGLIPIDTDKRACLHFRI